MPVVLAVALLACGDLAALQSSAESAPCGAQGCSEQDAPGGDGGAVDTASDFGIDAATESGSLVNPLCGVLVCNPDDDEASKCNDGESVLPDGGYGTDAAVEADAGEAGTDEPSADSFDGANHMGGSKTPARFEDGGAAPLPPEGGPGVPRMTCQVMIKPGGQRVASCAPAGSGKDGDACVDSADCAPGRACIGDENTGVCRSYCCLEPEGCDPAAYAEGSFCSVGPQRDRYLEEPDLPLMVPVCMPANKCELVPGQGGVSQCEAGKICAIVRADGTTACVLPGAAQQGEPCDDAQPDHSPCAEGLVCSKATSTSTCMKLCRVSAADACESGVCQAGTTSMPRGYGVCVGTRQRK
ncbi:MAG: hypothetical protein MUF54_01870 [Polyangiaceae bacterium]|nr:hypothetical protein [Polyangiaceae bacterium]